MANKQRKRIHYRFDVHFSSLEGKMPSLPGLIVLINASGLPERWLPGTGQQWHRLSSC